jgi:hypothetical protein
MSDILKYFHEEPALLEPLTPDRDPDARQRQGRATGRRHPDGQGPGQSGGPSMPLQALLDTDDYYRGYLAGSNRETDTVGLTALAHPEAFVEPVVDALGAAWWARASKGSVDALSADEARTVLRDPSSTDVLVTAPAPVDAERVAAAAGTARRHTLEALRRLLDAASVAFFPEPAHDGFDWSFFSADPMRERLTDALRARPAREVRCFVLPYQKARSESKFYFETWQLKEPSLPDYIEEV